MNWVGGIVVYAVLWFLTVLAILPIRAKSQESSGEVVPGTPSSAPQRAYLRLRMAIAAVIAGVLWLVVYYVVSNKLITIDDMAAIWGL